MRLKRVSDLTYELLNAKGEHVASIVLAHVNFEAELLEAFCACAWEDGDSPNCPVHGVRQ